MHWLFIVFTGYWLIVYLGMKWIDYQTWSKLDCDEFPGWLAAIIHTIFFVGCLEARILYIFAIPLASLATLYVCRMIRRYFVTKLFHVFLCSFYLTIWIYIVFAFLYFVGFFAILLAAIGGVGAGANYHRY